MRPHQRDEGGLLVEDLAEPDEKNVDELPFFNRVTKLAEFVSNGGEALIVDANGRGALDEIAKLDVEVVHAGVDVVLEELAKGNPECGGGRGVAEDGVEYLGGDARVDPLDDREVVLDPSWIIEAWNAVRGDVGEKIASPQMNLEEVAPVIVVVG
jgi:hypothetical protein